MSPDEREQWQQQLWSSSTRERNLAADALLDRVEQLERELAAARAAPPKPSHLVHTTGGHWHGFERGVDAYVWMQGNANYSPHPYLLYGWTWHPASKAPKETPVGQP